MRVTDISTRTVFCLASIMRLTGSLGQAKEIWTVESLFHLSYSVRHLNTRTHLTRKAQDPRPPSV